MANFNDELLNLQKRLEAKGYMITGGSDGPDKKNYPYYIRKKGFRGMLDALIIMPGKIYEPNPWMKTGKVELMDQNIYNEMGDFADALGYEFED